MSHLSIERLAALADEQPTADETTHLTRCAECARELEAHRSLLAMAGGERESMGIPLTRWESLSERLHKEGLVAEMPPRRSSWFTRLPMQIAAALLLVAGGAMLGRMSMGGGPLPADQSARVATVRVPDSLPTSFSSIAEANQWKAFYSAAYQSTVSYLAANDSAARPQTPAVMKARLSALDRVSRTMQEALNDAPYDPVINDFYLNSFGQREATLRQINTVLPQGVRMNSF
jgi:hypothetical protein